jgi:hypothetical protein
VRHLKLWHQTIEVEVAVAGNLGKFHVFRNSAANDIANLNQLRAQDVAEAGAMLSQKAWVVQIQHVHDPSSTLQELLRGVLDFLMRRVTEQCTKESQEVHYKDLDNRCVLTSQNLW